MLVEEQLSEMRDRLENCSEGEMLRLQAKVGAIRDIRDWMVSLEHFDPSTETA